MKRTIVFVFSFFLLVCAGVLSFLVFYPRKYDVPSLQPQTNMLSWSLATGSEIAYTRIAAKGQKKPFPVIYLHGGPGGFISDETVARFAPLSENGYDVYLYDQVGSGHSARLENIEEYTAVRHLRDLEEIVKKTGAEKVILIGQSWGAILAGLFTANHPGKVERLIFTGPGPIYPVRKELEAMAPPDSLRFKKPLISNRLASEKVKNLRSKAVSLFAEIFHRKLASDGEMDNLQTLLTGETNKSIVCDTSRSPGAQGGSGFYVQIMTMRSLRDVKDPRPALRNSSIPLYIMKGQCDNQVWGYVTEYLELFPRHRLVVIPDAGHSIADEQPELFLNTLREFIND